MLSFQPGTTLFGPSEEHMTFDKFPKIIFIVISDLYAGIVKELVR
jgi:hypothetical protein